MEQNIQGGYHDVYREPLVARGGQLRKQVRLEEAGMVFASERLHFDEWCVGDLPLLYDLHADPIVQAGYSVDLEAWTWPGIGRRLETYLEEQEKFGHTKWKLSLHDGTFVGRAGWSPYEGDLELGYALKPAFHRRGLAKEAAISSIEWARHHRPDAGLIAFALMNNTASCHILNATGMRLIGERMLHGAMHAFFRYEKANIS